MTNINLPKNSPTDGSKAVLFGGILAWAGGVVLLSASHVLEIFDSIKIALLIMLTIVLPVRFYFRVLTLRRAIDSIGLRGLTAVHLLRYFGAAWILQLVAQGVMYPLLATLSGWGDLIVASVALFVLVLPFARWRYIVAHIISLLDFTTSLTVGLYLTLTNPAAMAGGTNLPVSLILFFLIGFYSVNSIICLNALLDGRSTNLLMEKR